MDVITHSILPFAGILIALVVVHEAGHFVTAKLAGVKVLEFGIGYPPRVFGVRLGETEYTVNLLPLGGFVRLLGEEEPDGPRSLATQPAWVRLIVMGAGAFMNFVLAVFLFALALMIPREVSVGQAVIAQVVPDSPAAQAGLRSGDIIERIDGRRIDSVPDASYNIRLHLGEEVDIQVSRLDPQTQIASSFTTRVKPRWAPPPYIYVVQPGDTVDTVSQNTGFDRDTVRQAAGIETALTAGQTLEIVDGAESFRYEVLEGDTVAAVARMLRVSEASVTRAAGLPDQDSLTPGTNLRFVQGATGIRIAPQYPYTESRSYGVVESFRRGWQQTFDSLKLARNEIYSWIKGSGQAPVSGPIGIAQVTGEVVKEAGWKYLMDTAALLSINLAVLNVLPLPMLDGGRMAFVVLEILRRGRRIAPEREAAVHFVGMVAILILVVVLTYFDVARIVKGETLFR